MTDFILLTETVQFEVHPKPVCVSMAQIIMIEPHELVEQNGKGGVDRRMVTKVFTTGGLVFYVTETFDTVAILLHARGANR